MKENKRECVCVKEKERRREGEREGDRKESDSQKCESRVVHLFLID
jgi:hypothetical protein